MRIAILSLIGLVGCANSTEPHVFQACNFTDTEIETMQSAADEWCERSSSAHCAIVIKKTDGLESSTVELTETIESKHYFAGIVVESKHLDAVGNCLATVDHFGVRSSAECDTNTNADSYSIQVLDSRSGDGGIRWFSDAPTTWKTRLRTTFLHELGHSFGHAHLSRSGTVMNALTSKQVEHLTAFDLEN